MKFNQQHDQQRLSQRAHGIKRKQAQLERLYEFFSDPELKPFQKKIFTIKEWLIGPRTLPTFDTTGLCRWFSNLLKRKEPIDPAMELFLELIDDVPSEQCQTIIGNHEHNMLAGRYDDLLHDNSKFEAQLKRILADPEYHRLYKLMDDLFDLKSREGFNGLILHDFSHEPTRKPVDFDWSTDEARFRSVFTAFCRRFDLHGLEYGRPLLMKVKVETTPFGLVVRYPKWMSVDFRRDLAHKEITNLLRAYGADRQGAKLSVGQLEKEEMAMRALVAEEICQENGWVGERRHNFICDECGLSPAGTSSRAVRKLLELGRKLRANQKAAKPKTPAEPIDDPHRDIKLARAKASYLALDAETAAAFEQWREKMRKKDQA